METFGQPNLKHPYADYSLADAIQVANGAQSIRNEKPVTSLMQAREIVQDQLNSCGHQWITGYCALDVLDAAIDGRDLTISNRLGVGSEVKQEPPRARKQKALIDGAPLAGVPSDQLKAAVLEAVYHLDGFNVLSGFQFLAAQHRRTNVGIFVVAGNFGRDHFKKAISEAKAAGLNDSRVYVYGQTATYSGNAICFSKFDEIGVNMELASA